jgi:hypothetical protein
MCRANKNLSQVAGLDRALAKKAGSKRMSEMKVAQRAGAGMVKRLLARNMQMGRQNGEQRQQVRQEIRLLVNSG